MNQSGALAPVCTFVLPGVRNRLWATVLGQSAAWSTALACLLVAGPGQSVKMKA